MKLALVSLGLLIASNAFAQGTDATTAPAPAEPAPAEPAPPDATLGAAAPTPAPAPMPAAAASGPTLRNGFSLSAGQEFATVGGVDISGQLFGVDWRIGARINDALSVYADTHLSFGTAGTSIGGGGATGNFAAAVIGEYEFPFRLFVGGGGGYGVLNNPNGPLAQVRVGYYPFEHKSSGKARRLNLALDGRWYFVDAGGMGVTMSHIALSLGYDRF